MRIPVKLLIIFIILASSLPLKGVNFGYSDFSEVLNKQSVRGKTNTCALRDSYGFLWVGTMTGLSCFDGNGHPAFSNISGTLPATAGLNVVTLFEFGDDIWVGCTSGLYVFERKSNSFVKFPYKTKYGVPVSASVQKIFDAGNGDIWILTYGQGFFVFDQTDNILDQNSRYGSYYSDAILGPDGRIMVVSINGDLQSFTPTGHFIGSVHLPEYPSDKAEISMARIGNDIWVAAAVNLYRYDTLTRSIDLKIALPPHNIINSIIAGGGNNLYLGTDNGIWKYNVKDGALQQPTTFNSLVNVELLEKSVSRLSFDSDSSLLAVSPTAGVSILVNRKSDIKKVPTTAVGGAPNYVNALSLNSDNRRLWIGTDNFLELYDIQNQSISYPISQLADNCAITSLANDGDDLWIGTRRRGLYKFNQRTGDLRHYVYDENVPYSVISNDINDIYRTSEGEIFILTNWGMCKYDPEHDYFRVLKELDSNIAIIAMQEDADGRLWASTSGNQLRVRNNKYSNFDLFQSSDLESKPVTQMYLDSKGTLWVAVQDDKIMYFDKEKGDFSRLDDPVSKDMPVSFMIEDANGNLWTGSPGILAKIDSEFKPTFYFYESEGEYHPAGHAACRFHNGNIAISGGDCLWVFNPESMKADEYRSRALVQSVSFPFREDSEEDLAALGLDKLLYTLDEIRLPYTHNTFNLRLAASYFGASPNMGFEYKLDGVDKGWVVTNGSQASYSDLRPGSYDFYVRTVLGSDDSVSHLKVVVLPPWYRSRIAYAVYFVILLLLIWLAVILIRRKVRRHYQKRIDDARIKNERQMYETKMRFFVNLVHETRTPLTLMSIPLEQMSENAEALDAYGETDRKRIRSIRRNLDYLLTITNQLLDFRKAEHDSEVKLQLLQCDVNELIRRICHRFQHPMAEKGIDLQLEITSEKIVTALDVSKFDRVVMNLLGNAMKYAKSRVIVELKRLSDNNFVLSVIDDGTGIPESELEKIFETYYQINVDNFEFSLGTGLGLAYARLISRAHKGDIKARNTERGTSLSITLPILSEEEVKLLPEYRQIEQEEVVIDRDAAEAEPEHTILLVDDNSEMLSAVAEALGRYYNVVTATDGVEALDILSKMDNVSLIVSDFMMPRMDGAELCRQVKSNIETSHIPFVMLTAKTGNEARVEGLESGADVYIEKPFSIKYLKLQIANILKARDKYHALMRSAESVEINQPAASAEVVEKPEKPYITPIDAKFMESLNAHISENICDEEFSIDILAEKLNMSRSSFYRKIKGLTGMTPVDYLKNYRLDYSARLLREGVRVTEVALQSGFSSSSYFAKCFRAKFGMIPKEYSAKQSR